MAAVRMLRSSGAFTGELDPGRISIIGQSLGAIAGSLVAATEPNIQASVLNVPGGSYVDVARLAQERLIAGLYLATRNPLLVDDVCQVGPQTVFYVDDGYVLRDKAPVVSLSAQDLESQRLFELADWIGQSGDALAYAALLKNKRKLIQFAWGDGEVPNPTNSAFIRAADARTSSRIFRFDRATNYVGAGVTQPHRFMSNPAIFAKPEHQSVALAAQNQVASYLTLLGLVIPDANWFLTAPYVGKQLFETPASLPDVLNFTASNPCPN
jgi:hypothetical protein